MTLPPQNTSLDEYIIISNTLADPSEWENVRHIQESDFTREEFRTLWKAMKRAALDPYGINPAAIPSINPNISLEYIQKLIREANGSTAATTAAAFRISSIRRAQKTALRMREGANEIEQALQTPSGVKEWKRSFTQTMRDCTLQTPDSKTVGNADLEAELLRETNAPRNIIPTGLTPLDRWLGGGLMPGQMLGISAETKTGKTVMAATISYNLDIMENPIPHLLYSTERSKKEIGRLKLARRAGIPASKLADLSQDSKNRLSKNQTTVNTSFIVHRPLATIAEIEEEARYQVEVNQIKLLILDQYQLIGVDPGSKGTRSQQMNRISQELLRITDSLGIATIVMIQIDNMGDIADHGEPIQRAAHAILQIRRDIDSPNIFLNTKASCLGSEKDIGGITDPCMILDNAGPHIRVNPNFMQN